MGLCLYVGMDDSNHASNKNGAIRLQGEINLATFSFLQEDSIVKYFRNGRDYTFADNWLRGINLRDYRFTILSDDDRWNRADNLIYSAPILIRRFLRDNQNLNIDALKLYLDGHLSSEGKFRLRSEFKDFSNFVVNNFFKKRINYQRRVEKHPKCPTLVYVADVLANRKLDNSLAELLASPKFVPMNL